MDLSEPKFDFSSATRSIHPTCQFETLAKGTICSRMERTGLQFVHRDGGIGLGREIPPRLFFVGFRGIDLVCGVVGFMSLVRPATEADPAAMPG